MLFPSCVGPSNHSCLNQVFEVKGTQSAAPHLRWEWAYLPECPGTTAAGDVLLFAEEVDTCYVHRA